jgi:hypothetical protein
VLVTAGGVDVGEPTLVINGVLVAAAEVIICEEIAVVGTAVVFPPLRQVQALDILAGTLDQRAAYAGRV